MMIKKPAVMAGFLCLLTCLAWAFGFKVGAEEGVDEQNRVGVVFGLGWLDALCGQPSRHV